MLERLVVMDEKRLRKLDVVAENGGGLVGRIFDEVGNGDLLSILNESEAYVVKTGCGENSIDQAYVEAMGTVDEMAGGNWYEMKMKLLAGLGEVGTWREDCGDGDVASLVVVLGLGGESEVAVMVGVSGEELI